MRECWAPSLWGEGVALQLLGPITPVLLQVVTVGLPDPCAYVAST